MINIHAVTKAYGPNIVVRDVTLDLPAGGITALVGANGAGKSTLLSIIGRLLGADAGTVTIDGCNVATTPTGDLARRLSILRQDNHPATRLTVRDLVSFGRFPHSRGRLQADDHAHIERALDYLDLHDLADRYLDEISGGQRQRAFVAMVLCQDTPYVLLDEPLNNLDLTHAATMMRLLRRAADELGRTIVVVLHDLNIASCHADRIVAMRDGALVAQGPPAEVMTTPVLAQVFGVELDVVQLRGHPVALHFLPSLAPASPVTAPSPSAAPKDLEPGPGTAGPRGGVIPLHLHPTPTTSTPTRNAS